MMDDCKDPQLQAIFIARGREQGCDFVEARFYPFKELKSTWIRNRWKVSFRISDYMSASDTQILDDYAQTLFSRMTNGGRALYSSRVKNWLKSQEFIDRNRPLYLERSRNLALRPDGEFSDLRASLESLRDKGLVEGLEDVYLTWTRTQNRRRVGYCSVLMKVIAVSSALDSPKIPDFVSEYVLFHELLHIETGRESLSPRHGREFRRRERCHPRWEEAEAWLRRLALDGQGANP